MSNKKENEILRSSTPEVSGLAVQKMGLVPNNTIQHTHRRLLNPSQPFNTSNVSDSSKKKIFKQVQIPMSTNKPVVLQSKEGPEILLILKDIHSMLGTINTKLTAQDKKIDENTQHLKSLEEVVKAFQVAGSGMEFEKPNFIPFSTYQEVKLYDKSSEEDRQRMKKWLGFFNRRSTVADNVREILQKNRLMTDELLIQVVWEGQNGRKSSKFQMHRRRLTYDLRCAVHDMYPSMTDNEYKVAVQKALKAASSRIDQRKRKSVKGEHPPKKRKLSDVEFFNNEWAGVSESEDEDADEEVAKEKEKNNEEEDEEGEEKEKKNAEEDEDDI